MKWFLLMIIALYFMPYMASYSAAAPNLTKKANKERKKRTTSFTDTSIKVLMQTVNEFINSRNIIVVQISYSSCNRRNDQWGVDYITHSACITYLE